MTTSFDRVTNDYTSIELIRSTTSIELNDL